MLILGPSFLSHILGRPHMINRDTCDVEKLSVLDENGQRISFNSSRMVLIQLADITNDVLDKVRILLTLLRGFDLQRIVSSV
jgi:hypothetical protein